MIVFDATNAVVGRFASHMAKLALEGEIIRIVNAEHAVISGNPKAIIKDYTQKIHQGNALAGPFFPKKPDRILKRVIRGMLPYKKDRGRKALKHIKVYIGLPAEFKEQKLMVHKEALVGERNILKYISLKRLSNQLGRQYE